jgi:fatty-acyl-CoA synthase
MAAFEDEQAAGTFFAAPPHFHLNVVLVTTLNPLLKGRRTVWAPPLGWREPGTYGVVWQLVEHYRIQEVSAVLTVYAALAETPVDADISSLQGPAVGAAPLPDAVLDTFAARTGMELLHRYGLIEGTRAGGPRPPEAAT